nr:unnamed protein product [Callosobruchus chinensis]
MPELVLMLRNTSASLPQAKDGVNLIHHNMEKCRLVFQLTVNMDEEYDERHWDTDRVMSRMVEKNLKT